MITDYGQLILLWLRTSGFRVLFIVSAAFVSARLVHILIGRLRVLAEDDDPLVQSEREKRAVTLSSILKQVASITIAVIAFMMILHEFRLDIAPIIAGAGIVGLAVGFGAQSLVKDVISGFFILLENQYDVGDVISGAGVSGSVEKMNLRFTQLRDIEGRVHFIPNGEFRVISNLTRGWSRAVVDIGISYDEDVDKVQRVLVEVAEGLKADPIYGVSMIEPMEILGIESFAESAVSIRVLFKTLPGRQWPVAREFRKRVKRRFGELGIEIPFPHRVLVSRTEAPMVRASNAAGDSSPPAERLAVHPISERKDAGSRLPGPED